MQAAARHQTNPINHIAALIRSTGPFSEIRISLHPGRDVPIRMKTRIMAQKLKAEKRGFQDKER